MREKTAEEMLNNVRTILDIYEGWHVDCPEDSWRVERDLREAVGMPQADYE